MKKNITLIILLGSVSSIFSQSKEDKSFIDFSGSVGVFYEVYDFSQENYSNFRARFPDNLLRINAQATLNLGKYFSIPIAVNITNQKVLYNLPSLPEENLLDYIQNPANNISINPKFKWAQAFIGTQTPLYSPLSTGDTPIFGAGLELNPGKFLFSANYGISQRAVEPDILLNIPGAYEQKIMAARIGYGKVEGTKFTLNVIKIEDDITSLSVAPINVDPIEGVTVSPYFQFKIGKKFRVRTETAGSIYTSNVNSTAQIDEDFIEDIADFITVNGSSKADFAHNTRLDWLGEKFQMGAEVKYVGPGFLPVGYRFVERDILDYKVNTGMKLFNSKLNLTGSVGLRTNNLRDTKLSSTKRIIANTTAFAQISKKLNVSATYSNFGFNNDANLLNQRIELVNNSFTLSPTYQFTTKNLNHQIGLNLGTSTFDQFDVQSNSFIVTESDNYGLNYNLLFSLIPLNLNFQAIYVDNIMPTGDFKMLNYGFTAGYKLWKNKIAPSLAFNIANIDRSGFTTDVRTSLRFRMRYKVTKKLKFNFTYRFTGYTYGSVRPNAVVDQNRLQFSLQQQF